MRLLVTGPTAELSQEQQGKLGILMDELRDSEIDPTRPVLLHSGRNGVEAAAVEIAKQLGWEVQEHHYPLHPTNVFPPEHALVIWEPDITAYAETTPISELADAGVPVDVRHL